MSKALVSFKAALGNQMFTYAFCLYLQNLGYEIKPLWFSYLYTKHHHGVELFNCLKINPIFSIKGCNKYIKIRTLIKSSFINRAIGKLFRIYYEIRYKVKYQKIPYSFLEIEYCKNSVYFDGLWQNYKYLESIEGCVRDAFKFNLPENGTFKTYEKQILNSESISLHIRRGDYLSKDFPDLNVVKNLDYYYRAIEIIKQHLKNPKIFIFSDDKDWVKRNLKLDNYEIVEGNTGQFSYLDMYLMSICKHNIICNSTFSWWGAYLNNNPQKIVIAPSLWTTNYSSNYICPKDWILVNP